MYTTFYRSYVYALSLFMVFASSVAHAAAVGLLVGSIEFPKQLKTAPTLRMYYEGQIVKTEINDNKLLYRIPTSRAQWRYFLLFIDDIDFVLKNKDTALSTQNTVDYLVANPDTPYRVFELQKHGDQWVVIERLLPENGRIPDSTIIVLHSAADIGAVAGGNNFQLPTITMKDDIVSRAGSEESLHDMVNQKILASLDYDAIHVTMNEHLEIKGNCILSKPAA